MQKNMKKCLLMAWAMLTVMVAQAEGDHRPMLREGKTWWYVYHHVKVDESDDRTQWEVAYRLKGDTVIGGKQYMKMYRYDDEHTTTTYYGAYREEDGRVYRIIRREDAAQEVLLIDFSTAFLDSIRNQYYPEDSEKPAPLTRAEETIKVGGMEFRRYRYKDDSLPIIVGVEGVGFEGCGITEAPFEPQPTCICDHESFARVFDPGIDRQAFSFSAQDFNAPKQILQTDEERRLTASNNDFALRLFRQISNDKSLILSPLGITYALGMLNNGAAGLTRQEINDALGFGDAGAEAINAFCRKMLTESGELDNATKVMIANTIYMNKGYQLKEAFVEKAHTYYDADPETRDFWDGVTMDVINQWAYDHTEGMIKDLLNENTFDPNAVSYLLNAIFFKGIWASPFDKAFTIDMPFRDGGPSVPMMIKESKFEYGENDTYQFVHLPYGNGAYRMTIMLPKGGKLVSDVLEQLNGNCSKESGVYKKVQLWLPRFTTESEIDLVNAMKALGMSTAFCMDAEFPDFCNADVYISNMFQKAKIELDEEGTKAAAVTVIEVGESSMPDEPVKFQFRCDHPFLYLISEQSTGTIFFVGQYMGETTDAITTVTTHQQRQGDESTDAIYNLNGQRLNELPARGIVIRNGQKVVLK